MHAIFHRCCFVRLIAWANTHITCLNDLVRAAIGGGLAQIPASALAHMEKLLDMQNVGQKSS